MKTAVYGTIEIDGKIVADVIFGDDTKYLIQTFDNPEGPFFVSARYSRDFAKDEVFSDFHHFNANGMRKRLVEIGLNGEQIPVAL